jgi:hypothetical protein
MIRQADGPTIEVTIEVAATDADLWPLISDIDLPARFSEEYQGGEWIDGAGPALGARFRGSNRHARAGEWSTECTVIVCEPRRSFGWAVGDVTEPSAAWRFDLEPSAGITTLSMRARLGPGRSMLTAIIEAYPEREDELIRLRLDEWRTNMSATIKGIKTLAESI